MSPLIEKESDINDMFFTKFLRYGDEIIYEHIGNEDGHLLTHYDIARKHNRKPYVDDGGYINPNGNPFEEEVNSVKFVSTTETCFIKGDEKEQRKETVRIARQILGDEKVGGK